MAKKITGYVKLQVPAGKATPAPPIGPALGHPRCYHGLSGPYLHLRHQDSPGSCSDQEGMRHRVRFRRSQPYQGCNHHQGTGFRDR